jgi:hypothetical protein
MFPVLAFVMADPFIVQLVGKNPEFVLTDTATTLSAAAAPMETELKEYVARLLVLPPPLT